jgi:hypothetical protein
MDLATILAIADRLVPKGIAIFSAFQQAVKSAGADDAILAALVPKYDAAIAAEEATLAAIRARLNM